MCVCVVFLGRDRRAESGGKPSDRWAFVRRRGRLRRRECLIFKYFSQSVWMLLFNVSVSQASGDFGSGEGDRRQTGHTVRVSLCFQFFCTAHWILQANWYETTWTSVSFWVWKCLQPAFFLTAQQGATQLVSKIILIVCKLMRKWPDFSLDLWPQ